MYYGTYEKYIELYEAIDIDAYKNLAWEADRLLDKHTTGIDNVRKLRVAFPTDEYDAEAVRRCEFALVYRLYRFDKAEKAAAANTDSLGDGVTSGIIETISSGTESITYATDTESMVGTPIDAAVGDVTKRQELFARTIRDHLTGVTDANGVNLLYMGVYPHVH